MTRFQLLAKYEESPENRNQGWLELIVEDAHNGDDAIKKAYLAKPDGKIVAVVAVPLRSWKPKVIRAENVIKVQFGDGPAAPEEAS